MSVEAYCSAMERKTGHSRSFKLRNTIKGDIIDFELVTLPDCSPEAIDVQEHATADDMAASHSV